MRFAASRPVGRLSAYLFTFFASAFYAFFAIGTYLSNSPLAVCALTTLVGIGTLVALVRANRDFFEPLNVVTLLYLMLFAIGPLVEPQTKWHYHHAPADLLSFAATYALACYVVLVLGYVCACGRFRTTTPPSAPNQAIVRLTTLSLFGVGMLGFLILFVSSGGLEGAIQGGTMSGQNRGAFFWASLLMCPGGALYFSERAVRGRLASWCHAWPLVFMGSCYSIFGSRSSVFLPLVVALLIGHYRIRRLPIVQLGVFFAFVFVLGSFMGFARNEPQRSILLKDPLTVVDNFRNEVPDVARNVVSENLTRLHFVMLIFDRVPSERPFDSGRAIIAFFDPVFSVLRLKSLLRMGVGPELFHLVVPYATSTMWSGWSVSLIGELRWSFPAAIAVLILMPFGVLLRFVYERSVLSAVTFFNVAVYAVMLPGIVRIVLNSVGNNLFPLLVTVVPLLVAGRMAAAFASHRRARSAARARLRPAFADTARVRR